MALPEVVATFPSGPKRESDTWALVDTVLLKNGEPLVDLHDVGRIERRMIEFGGRQQRRFRLVAFDAHYDIDFDRRASNMAFASFRDFEDAVVRRFSETQEDGVVRERRFDNLMLVPVFCAIVAAILIVGWGNPMIEGNPLRAGAGLVFALAGVLAGLVEYRPWALHRFDTSADEHVASRGL